MQKTLRRWAGVFLLPTIISFFVVFLVPFFMGVYLSFTEFTTVADAEFVGFSNYIRAFTQNKDFVNALRFTVSFALVAVVTVNVAGFLLALALTRALKGTKLFRAVFFMPNLIGGIVLGYIWKTIINGILYKFGVDLTFSATYGFWGLVAVVNWQLIGYMMIIYIAGLQNVPNELLEASAIDGANAWQTLWRVKIPTVMPSITICTFLTLTNAFKLFDQNLSLTAGAPGRESAMLALDIYNTFYGRIGYEGVGQAKAVVFFLLVTTISILQLWLSRRGEVEQ